MDTWSHCFSFLGIRDHIRLSVCSKWFRAISKNPHAATHGWFNPHTPLIGFRPKKFDYWESHIDLASLTTLESLILRDHCDISTLNITSLQYIACNALTNVQLRQLPLSLISIKCDYELSNEDISLDHLTNLKKLTAYEICCDISKLSLRELCLDDFEPTMIFPSTLEKLTLNAGSELYWMRDFQYHGKFLHLNIELSKTNIDEFKSFRTKSTIILESLTLRDIVYFPDMTILALNMRGDITQITHLSQLEDIILYSGDDLYMSITCSKSRYWPNLKTMYLHCNVEMLPKILSVLHDPDNIHTIKTYFDHGIIRKYIGNMSGFRLESIKF